MKYYILVKALLPQGETELGFEIEATSVPEAMERITPADVIHEHITGHHLDLIEITTKKRRGVDYV